MVLKIYCVIQLILAGLLSFDGSHDRAAVVLLSSILIILVARDI